jgi:hypothetical protein
MIKTNLLLILNILLVFVLAGCSSTGFLMASPEVTIIGNTGDPKSPTENIDIYYTKKPEQNYEEIAIIKVGDTDDNWSFKQIKIKARELGADGAIIIGRTGSYVYVTGVGTGTNSFSTSTGVGAGEGYGLEAIAIRYK